MGSIYYVYVPNLKATQSTTVTRVIPSIRYSLVITLCVLPNT